MKKLLFFLLAGLFSGSIFAQEKIEVTWHNAVELGIEGRGWTDTKTPYDRLPRRAEKNVPEGVWARSMNSAGMSISFATDATMVVIRWKVRHPSVSSPYLSSMSVAGLDLYVRESDRWFWAATKPPQTAKPPGTPPETTETFLRGLTPKLREYRLYLPSYNGVEKVEVGVPKDSKFGKVVEKETKKPIVFYGSSIVQGSASSRPGMTYVAQLGRRLDRGVINLGFSGLCKMESALAELLAELDPAVFVIDCLPNMQVKEIAERTVPLVKKIRDARPDTPIVLVENPMYSQTLWNPETLKSVNAKNKLLADEYEKLKRAGVANLHYVKGDNLFGTDGNSTVDGVHPTDLGFTLFADALEPILREILVNQEKK
jgi:lysophospholipase L1-like esterase